MATNSDLKDDEQLESALRSLVAKNFKRTEILDFVMGDLPNYEWSLQTLDCRLRKFEIYYINYDTPIDTVRQAVQTELDGPGKLLGYWALNMKLRTEHEVQVPRHLVYHHVMQ